MNNVFAVGGQAVTLTANTNTPSSRFPSTPPSPTAVAINLLNLLKIANTMSHPLYNPFVSGKPSSSQGQYGLASGQTERDPRKVPSHLGSATSFSSSGMSSLTLGTSGGPLPSLLGLSVNYRPERGRITVDEEIERCLDLNISKAREEVRLQSLNQNPHFTSTQRDQFPSSSTEMTSYLTPSICQPSSGSRSLDWLPICKLTTEDNASKIHSSASSSFLGSSDGRLNTSSDGNRDVQSIPGLGEYDKPMPDKFVPPQESSWPKYTSESATSILLHFGLEKDDLEHLISYPEDQITPDNLPFILRQIRVDKEKRTSTAVKSKPYSEPQPITTVSGMNKLAPTSSRGTVLNQDEISSLVLKPSKVIDYGHTGKYTAGAGKEMGRAVGSTAKVGGSGTDTYKNISHGREALPKSTTEFKSGSFVSSCGQMSSVPSFSTPRSSMAPPSSGQTKQLETQPLPKPLPLKQPELDGKPACNLFRGVHPGRPGLVLIGSNEKCQNSNRNLIKMLKASERMKNLQGQQQMKQQPRQQTQPHQAQPPQQQPRIISGMKPGPPPPSNVPVHLARHQPIPKLMTIVPRMLGPPPKEQFQAKMVLPKHLPISSMMQDYTAATPTIFPHTCSLCIKECTTMEAWLVHQNTGLHLENCRLLRTRYPDWDGKAPELQSAPSKDAQPLCSTSAEISLSHHQKSRLASPSRSHSPHRLRGSVDGRQKRSSRSRSRSPRHHHHGSEERRQKRSSRSPHHNYAPENRRERRSSRSRSPYSSQHSQRSNPRSLTPRNDRPASSRYHSRSRSHERRSSPRRREDRRSSPRRSHESRSSPRRSYERRSSPRRSHERRSSPRRSHERRSPPRRSDDKRLSPRRSFERRSSADRSLPQRRRSRSAERLAKRLLETPAVQSLSKKSDLEAMVKTLAPALLAELSKMKSSSSAASSSSTKSTKLKSGASSSSQHKSATAPISAKVRIKATSGSLSQHDVTTAVEKFGKIKSVVLFRSSKEAVVCFEREEDAKKLRAMTSFDVNKLPVSIIQDGSTGPKKTQSTKEKKTPTTKEQKTPTTKEQTTPTTKEQTTPTTKEQKTPTTKEQKTPTTKEQKTPTTKEQKTPTTKEQKTPTTKEQKTPTTKEQKTPTTKEQKAAPQQKSAKSSVSTTQTTKSNSSAKVKTPSSSGAKNTTTSNVPKAKVLVSNTKNVSPKQVAKTAKTTNANGKGTAKSEAKKETSVVPKSKSTEKRPEAGDSKPKTTPTKSESHATKSAVAPNETAKAKEQSNTTVAEPIKKEKIVTEAKNLASKGETSSTAQKPEMQPEQVALPEAVKIEQVAETCAKDNNLTSKSANQPGAAEIKVQESMPVHEDTTIDVETKEATASEIKHLKECPRVDVETEDVEPVVPEETGAIEPMEVDSFVESKDQNLTETKMSPTKPSESHPVTTAVPCTSPPKSSTEPPQRVKEEETLLEMSSQVQPSASPNSGSAVEDHKMEAETMETQEQGEKPTEMKPEDQVTGVEPKCEPAPEPVSNISAGSPEAASSAITQPADETESNQETTTAASCAHDDVTTSTVNEKLEEHQQQEETGCVQTETVVSSTSAPPDLSNNEEQTTPEESISVSPIPTTSAKSTPSDSVKEESVDTDMKEVVVDSTISHETSETMKKEQSPKTPVTSADKPTIPAGFSTTVSVTDPVKTEENALELPHIDEDIFKAFTTVLREHKRIKGTRTKSKEKESTTISKTTSISVKKDTQKTKAQDEDFSSDMFNESDFSFEDFVTVDEITEDMEDTAVHSSSSSSNPTYEKKERQSSNVTPSSKRTTSETSKDCKSSISASSSSSTAKSSKTSSTSSSKSVETRVSPRQKAQPSKTKTPNRASQTSPKGRSTSSSTTAVKTSVQTNQSHKKENKPTDSTVAETDHKVSAESSAAKTVESESKTKTSKMDPPAQGEKLEITHQTHSLETELKDETQKEVKTSKEKEMKMNEDGQSTEEDEDYENFQIIDSLDEQTDEPINEKDKDSTETQTLGPEKDQILHQGCLQVSETADDDKANPEASSKMEIDQSILVQDSADKIKTVTADDEDKGSIVMQESEDAAQVAHNSEESLVGGATHNNQVLDQDTDQTPRSGCDGAKEIEILSEELRRTSKEADQISDELKPLENIDSKDTEQEASVNSADDQTITKGKKLEAPNQETSQTDVGTTEEDEDVYQVIDSLEDQPTTETKPETNKEKQTKKGSATTSRDERPTRSSRSKSRTSKIEDKGKSPKKQDITGKKHETSVKDSKAKKDKKIDESSEEMVFEVVDSIESDPIQEASTTRRSGRRQSARRHKEDEKTLNLKEEPDKSSKKEETMYKVLDSVGEETSSEKPSTRSTRGRKEKNEISSENEKTKKDQTPTRRRHTPSRDSHEKDKEKTSKTSANDSLKGSTPTKSDTVVRDTSEEEVTYEILDAVEEEEADKKPTTQKSRRGRPKKDVKPTKKETKASKGVDLPQKVAEEEEGATYQILDSVEGEIDDQATTDQTENTRKSTPSAKDDSTTKKRTRSSKKKEEEEPLYQVVDSLEDDQEELIRDVSGVQEEKSDTKNKKADSVPSGSSAVEALKKAGVEDKDVLQGVKDVPSAEGSKTEGKGSPPKSDVKKQEEPLTKSKRDATKSEKAVQKSPKKKDTTVSKNALVSLDEVSNEEEDYPDDTVKKEEIKTTQTASEGRENKQKDKRTREKDTREPKSQSRSRGGSVEMEKKTKEVSQEKEEKVEAENQELVTLDEVGEDETEEAGVRESPKCDSMLMEGELQELVTLDEINEEDGKEKPGTLEAPSLSQESQSGDSLKPEILSALDEAAHDEDKKADTEDTKETSSSVKRKLDDNTEESEDFLTVDEVRTTEQEDKKPATEGQPKKRSRRTPVKHLTEVTMDSKEHKEDKKESLPQASGDLSSTPDKHSTALSGDAEIQKTEMKTATVSTEQQLQSESPDEQKLDGCEQKKEKEKRSRIEVTAVDKPSQELTEPEAKRPRSESPSLPVDFKLPPFNPKSPLGQEFIVPKSGFFCNLCSIFYFKENVAKGTHCSSQKHYDNLLKHYQKLQQKTSSSTQNSQGPVSDGSN